MATGITVRDRWTFSIAIGILIGFFVFFGIAFVDGVVFSPSNDYTGIERVSGTLGALIGSVVGYYFGHQPVRSLTERIDEQVGKNARAKNTLVKTSKFSPLANRQNELLKKQLQAKDDLIQYLTKKEK
jgi:membrane protein YqaA with SNARE-associated domain